MTSFTELILKDAAVYMYDSDGEEMLAGHLDSVEVLVETQGAGSGTAEGLRPEQEFIDRFMRLMNEHEDITARHYAIEAEDGEEIVRLEDVHFWSLPMGFSAGDVGDGELEITFGKAWVT